MQIKMLQIALGVRNQFKKIMSDERGEFVFTIGWMAVAAIILVLAHGMIKGWLPGYINKIFNMLDGLN